MTQGQSNAGRPKQGTGHHGNNPQMVTMADCHHTVYFKVSPPMIGDEIWCVKCADMRRVESAPIEYRVRCKRCTYSRSFGVERLHAERAAMLHRQRRGAHHLVGIYNGRKLIYVMGAKDAKDTSEQLALFPAQSFPQDPPF